MSDEEKPRRRRWFGPGPVGGRPVPLDQEQWTERIVARGIYRIALVAVLSIAVISVLNSLLQGEVLRLFSDNTLDAEPIQFADESISVLGNIASAAVGGLVGYWSRWAVDTVNKYQKEKKDDES